jgi:hypothetical protein
MFVYSLLYKKGRTQIINNPLLPLIQMSERNQPSKALALVRCATLTL